MEIRDKLPTIGLLLLFTFAIRAETDYRKIVVKFADTLLEHGRDRYGVRHSPLWMGVINTKDYSVPTDADQVPALRQRSQDRAVGGTNLAHDVVTIRVFDALARIKGQARYRRAVDEYLRYYLTNAQSPATGLLAWGEHMYYDAFADRVRTERRWHELFANTPPWDRLWQIDRRATERAIAGIYEWHFFDKEKALFNRHGDFLGGSHADPAKSQPWIKHSALYTYSFAFAYAKTGETRYLDWARAIGALYWKARDQKTNLVEVCLLDPLKRPATRLSFLDGQFAYWLYKAGELAPSEREWGERAIVFMEALDRYGYDAAAGSYLNAFNTDGTPTGPLWFAGKLIHGGTRPLHVWDGEGGSVIRYGSVAAYIAARSKRPQLLTIARRVEKFVHSSPRQPEGDIGTVGIALNLTMDLYDLTGESVYLDHAREYAEEMVAKYWRGGLFRSHTGYEFYEAHLRVGDAVQGLLRLSLAGKPAPTQRPTFDWSF